MRVVREVSPILLLLARGFDALAYIADYLAVIS